MTMSLFGNNDNPLTKEQQTKVTLAELGGGAVGAGLGALGGKVMNAANEKKTLIDGLAATKDKEVAEGNWRTLLSLQKGEITLEDLPVDQRKFFAKQLQENAGDLTYMANNYKGEKDLMNELRRGKVEPLFPDQKPSLMNLLFQKAPQTVDLTKDNVEPLFRGANEHKMEIPHKYTAPKSPLLTGGLGIAGMMGAGYALKKHYANQNEGTHNEDDLQRLQNMLNALQNREE